MPEGYPKLKIVQVLVQPIAFLEVAEDDLRPLEHQPAPLSRKDFESYVSSGRFKDEVEKWEQQLRDEAAAAPPNRATRRRKAAPPNRATRKTTRKR